jgi:hypothetical protein
MAWSADAVFAKTTGGQACALDYRIHLDRSE